MFHSVIAAATLLVMDRRVHVIAALALALVGSVLLGAHEASAGLSTSPSGPRR
jgi:hypothetical protein